MRDVSHKMLVHFDFVRIEFDFGGVKQGLAGGKSRNNVVHGLDEGDDVGHCPVRHRGGDVACHRIRKGRADVAAGQFLVPSPFAIEDIAKALNENVPSAKHIRELTDLLSVENRLMERLGEIMRAKNRHIGVRALLLFIRMAIHDREIVVVVLLGDETPGVLAEGADLVFERSGVTYQLRFIKDRVELFHHFVADFDPHAHIDGSGLMGDIVFRADFLKPIGAPSSRGDHDIFGHDLLLIPIAGFMDDRTRAGALLENDVVALIAEHHLDAGFFEILLNRKIQIMRLLGSEMADRAIDQFETRFNRAAPDRLNLFALIEAFDVFVGPEGEINLIGVFDEGLDFVEAEKIRKFASDLGRKLEFSIAEGTRARKAGRDGARIAVQAFSGDTFGAAPRLDRMAFFDHQNLFLAAIFKQFERGENTRRPRTDD